MEILKSSVHLVMELILCIEYLNFEHRRLNLFQTT